MKEKSYNLFGSTWIIQFVDEVVDENDKWLFGETESPSRVITISRMDCKMFKSLKRTAYYIVNS